VQAALRAKERAQKKSGAMSRDFATSRCFQRRAGTIAAVLLSVC
jgi:hypothetical protein